MSHSMEQRLLKIAEDMEVHEVCLFISCLFVILFAILHMPC